MTPCWCSHEAVDHHEGRTRCLVAHCPCRLFSAVTIIEPEGGDQ